MLDTVTAIFGLAIIFGPLAAFALCRRTAEHANDPPDIVGGLMAGANILFLGLTVTLYLALQQVFPLWLAGSIQALAIISIQYFLWRRALRNTRCGQRLALILAKFRSNSAVH